MDAEREIRNEVSLARLVDLFGFTTMPELAFEGMKTEEGLYRRLVVSLAQRYFQAVHLNLVLAGEDRFLLEPLSGEEWEDAAYWVGNVINLESGQELIASPSSLLRFGRGREKPYADLREAVLDNLEAIADAPEVLGLGKPDTALRKALENAEEVSEVRGIYRREVLGG